MDLLPDSLMLDALRLELHSSVRRLVRTPMFTVTAVVSLAMGIAATVTMVGVVDTLLFRPPAGVPDADRVVGVGPWAGFQRTTYPDYTDLRDGAHAFEAVGAFAAWQYTARIGDAIVPARGMLASASLLRLLGTTPVIGRIFTADEDRPGAPPVVLISHALWLDRFGGAPDVLGRTLQLADHTFTIIGVLPPGFTAPDLSPADLVLPITNTPHFGARTALTSRDFYWVRIVARLRPGITDGQASVEATTIYRRANLGVDGTTAAMLARDTVLVRSLTQARRDTASPSVKISLWLLLLGAAVLLVACTNVSGLFLARAVREQRELAIRAALGSSRARLVSRVLLDVTLLVVTGTLLAIGLARSAGAVLTRVLLVNTIAAPPLDARSLLGAVVVALIALMAAAAAPLVRGWFVSPRADLAAGAHTISGGHRRALRAVLVVQLALATVLTAEAALFGVSLRNASHVDLGIDTDHLLVADVDLYAAGLSGARADAAIRRALEAVAGVPGVLAAGMTNAATLPGFLIFDVSVPGRDSLPGVAEAGTPSINAVTAHYLSAIGVPVRRGRGITEADVAARRPVALVSERFAELHWPGANPIGQCVILGHATGAHRRCVQVVGVVGDRRGSPVAVHGAVEVYVPLGSVLPATISEVYPAGDIFPGRELALRVTGSAARVAPAVRSALLRAVPGLTSVRVRTGDAYVERLFRTWRLGAGVLGVFGAVALALGAIGVFAVSSHVVAQRTRELGIRGALGARPADLAWLVARESAGLAVAGVVIGTVASLAGVRITQSLTFGISALDPRLYAAAGLLLMLTALVAACVPARRAAAVDPATALRSE